MVSEKQFFEIDYDEIYYIVDSSRLQRKKTAFEDEEEYQKYCLENSMSGKEVVSKLNEQQATIEHYRKSRDKWKQKALAKDEQLKDCDNDCFNCKFYNKVCDFCTKFSIGVSTNE